MIYHKDMILLFDGDGVVLKKFPYFTKIYSRRHNVPIEKFNEFFAEPFKLCQKGKGDLKKGITPYLKSWQWNKSADEFLEYWFATDVEVQPEVLKIIENAKKNGYKTYLASEQEKYRAAWIKNILAKDRYFTDTFFSCDLKFNKDENKFYQSIINRLEADPKNIYYWDDDKKNIITAKNLGINAFLFKNIENFKQETANLLNRF